MGYILLKKDNFIFEAEGDAKELVNSGLADYELSTKEAFDKQQAEFEKRKVDAEKKRSELKEKEDKKKEVLKKLGLSEEELELFL